MISPKKSGKKKLPAQQGSIRIIGGQFKRRILQFPAIEGVRPSPDRIRETLFNWLGQTLEHWKVCDLFAGSGGLSLEALSRYAEEVIAIEAHPIVARALQTNAQSLMQSASHHLPYTPSFQVIQQDIRQGAALLPKHSFDLVCADPPFGSIHEWQPAILQIAENLLKPQGWLYLESPMLLTASLPWKVYRSTKAGKVVAHLWSLERN